MRLRNHKAVRRKPPHVTLLHRSQGPGGDPSGSRSNRDDGTLVLLWPARPSSCPIPECNFVTSASGVTVATSIDHHLARRHGTQMGRRLWRCTHCNNTMAGLETREHRCVKPAGGPKRSKGGPPVPAPAQPRRSSLTDSARQDGPTSRRHDGDERSPAADPRRMTARPETSRPTVAARNDLPGGDVSGPS